MVIQFVSSVPFDTILMDVMLPTGGFSNVSDIVHLLIPKRKASLLFSCCSSTYSTLKIEISSFLHSDLFWTAPEFLRDLGSSRRGTYKGDVYSFSIILQEVVVRGPPYCMLDLPAEGMYQGGGWGDEGKHRS